MRDATTGNILSGDVIVMVKERATGEQIGLNYLANLLALRETDLREKIKQNEARDNQLQ